MRITQFKRIIPMLGVADLLEFPWDTEDDDAALCEHVRETGMLNTDSLGSVWGAAKPSQYYGWYNPGAYSDPGVKRKPRHYAAWRAQEEYEKQEREKQLERERIADKEWKEEEDRRKKAEVQEIRERLAKEHDATRPFWERAQERSNHLKAQQIAREAEERRALYEAQKRATVERNHRAQQTQRDLEELRQRELQLDAQRDWAIQTSEIERRITVIVDCTVAAFGCSEDERTLLRAMLRFMNLGDGRGRTWDAGLFVVTMSHVRRNKKPLWTRDIVERCHAMLVDPVWHTPEMFQKLRGERVI